MADLRAHSFSRLRLLRAMATSVVATSLLATAVLAGFVPVAHSSEPSMPALEERVPEGVWPLDPEPSVVAHFDPPEAPWAAGHRGVDLAGAPGQLVLSALDGEIGFTGSIAGKPVVTVLHGGLRTTYEPVVATLERGDHVAAGEPIGRLVVPAGHCFPAACLHWGLRRGEDYLDPLSLVGGGPIRLLPLWRDLPAESGSSMQPWVPPFVAWRRPLDFLP